MSTNPLRMAASAASLLTGSGLAGLLNLAALPFIARLYTPEVIGVGVVFLAIHSFLLVIVTGRYTMAIPLPKQQTTAIHLFWLVAALSSGFGLLITAAGFALREQITDALSMPELFYWLPYLGLTVTIAALSEAVDYGLIRHRRFKFKAMLGFGQATVTIICLLGFGLLSEATVSSYVVAQVVGICAAGVLAAAVRYPDHRGVIRWSRMLRVAACYRHLPKHLLTTGVLNAGSMIALPLVISSISGPVVVAVYSISAQLVGRPLGMISSAIWQVVYGQLGNASANVPQTRQMLQRIYMTTSLLYSAPLITIIAFPDVATQLLGHKWQGVGPMMQVFVVMAYFQYTSNSVSYFQSFGKYTAESVVNTSLVILRFSALFFAAALGLDGYHTVMLFCLVSAGLYLSITTYWSRVLGLGYQLPLRGVMTFALASAASWFGFELFSNPLNRALLIGVLLVGVGYAFRRQFSTLRAYEEPKS